jgi:hypothetical protein
MQVAVAGGGNGHREDHPIVDPGPFTKAGEGAAV